MANFSAGDPLRVLLVGEDEQMRDVLTEALRGRIGDFRLFWVAQPELATTRVHDLVPHLIVVDDALGGGPAPLLVKQLLAVAPASPIIVLVAESAIGTARQSIVAGARSFATKPISPAEFVANVRDILSQKGGQPVREESSVPASALGRIIVFCAPKGGTGRTTTAINTAIALHRSTNRSLVLIDADFAAPSVDVALNLHDDHDLTDLLPRLAQFDPELASGILATHASGIKALLAPPPAELQKPVSVPQVQQILAQLKRMFGWVVVDLGLPTDETAFAFLDSADRIVMTVLPEMTGLRNTRLMLNQFKGRGYASEKLWLVLNRATIPAGVSKADIEKRLHVQIAHTIPDDQPLVSHSINRGVPFMMSKSRGAVGKAIQAIADHLAAELVRSGQSRAATPASGSLLSRLTTRNGSAPASQAQAAPAPTNVQKS